MSAWSAASMPVAIRLWCRATMATGSGKRQFCAAGFTPTSCRRTDGHIIADANGAAGDHLGIDPALVVAEAAHQRGRDVEVAHCSFRVDIGRGATRDPLHDLQARLADGEGSVEQFGLMPRRP